MHITRATRLRFVPFAALGLTASTVIAGCGNDEMGAAMDELTGRTFLSTEIAGAAIPGGGPLRLEFGEDSRIIANAGCNTASGTARLESGRIITGELAMTLIGCPPETAGADEWLGALFAAEPEWTLEDATLTLRTDNGQVTLVDRTVMDPDRALIGTEWVVDSLIERDAISTSTDLEEARPTLTIDEYGRATGNTGCNNFNATAEIEEDRIIFGPLATTRMACLPGRDEIERAVLQTLSSTTVSVSIEAATLTLMTDAGHGLRFYAAQ
ncbi:META domain-containing protein [Hoyosella sp. YIM 151337]|uniref:META domain-containing protein n=1 Tax=Hoyosella sp. YIM 151337 TaxID=2992742 RepID=UPI0022356B3D|nr:META domain-containing protein [Hoyosella sp. YIM 151337]MCW4354454.1 META domain-containing protein [Hoyosella sp. YIM 151337]